MLMKCILGVAQQKSNVGLNLVNGTRMFYLSTSLSEVFKLHISIAFAELIWMGFVSPLINTLKIMKFCCHWFHN